MAKNIPKIVFLDHLPARNNTEIKNTKRILMGSIRASTFALLSTKK